MAEKLFYSMGEVAEMFDVNQSLIRYWESKFDVLRPKKNKKGNRMFRPEDIENFKIIYHLVKEQGMTLEGARRAMKQRGTTAVSRDAELMERLQNIRSMLAEVREMLKVKDDDIVVDDKAAVDAAAPDDEAVAGGKAAGRRKAVKVIEPKQPAQEPAEEKPKQKLPFYEQTLF